MTNSSRYPGVSFRRDRGLVKKLASKIINGGSGSWGEVTMAAHPQISNTDAEQIVD